ncbi:MAG: FAD binding domain-containing protein [Acidimicrobiia bacterium]|nr:FAD binding domain-containing protein [Acidimicrobiia bacterium]
MDCEHPHHLDAALAALGDDPAATVLAGGTDVMVDLSFGQPHPVHVIALRRVVESAEWQEGRIGAGVTYRRLERGPPGALAQASRTVGSPQIRNTGTIGGNVATASPAGDTLPVIAACDAAIEVASRDGGVRVVSWADFFTGVKQTSLRPGELVTAIVFPDPMPAHHEFAKIGVRNAMVISMVSACVTRSEDGTTRVALGSVAPTPLRATAAEEMISAETNPGESALTEFSRLVSAAVRPITDHRGTESYRRHASGVLARRLLERCLRREPR